MTESEKAIAYIEQLRNPEGTDWAGQLIKLCEWEKKYLRDLFDTLDDKGNRRYEQSALFIVKKQGKTTFIAALALYLLHCWHHQQIKVLAQTKEQAGILYGFVASMIRQNEYLAQREICRAYKSPRRHIVCHESDSTLDVLSSDAVTANGFGASICLFDEIFFSQYSELWDAVISGGINRKSMLAIGLGTAGMDTSGWGFQFYEHAKAVSANPSLDPSFLPVIYEAPDNPDWKNIQTYLDCSPTFREIGADAIRRIQGMIAAAEKDPSQLRRILRYHLNKWIGGESKTPWISIDKWDASNLDVRREDLRGHDCWGGIDLSSTTDLTALALVFPLEGEKYAVIVRFYMPWDKLVEAERRDGGAQYTSWARQGYIVTTPGNVVDYSFIEADLAALSQEFHIREIGYDPWNMSDLARRLEEKGFMLCNVRQGARTISPAAKEFERIVIAGNLCHFMNPVFRWNITNCVAPIVDNAGSVMPSKKKSTGRIDGIYATLNALAVELLDRRTRGSGAGFYSF